MRVCIVGAGPTGLFAAIALARRGHRVTIVDRDRGPARDGTWQRRGVMQFHHPHGLRRQIADVLDAELPEVTTALLAAGAVPSVLPAEGDRPATVVGLQCRRSTFERVLRGTAVAEPGVAMAAGHVDEVLSERGRVAGVRVDGRALRAELVLNASGRSGRVGDDLRAPGERADCGLSYVSRHYALRPGAEPGPVNSPPGLITRFRGYVAAVFLQDNRTICTLIARLSSDRRLADLRFTPAFDAAVRAIPGLAEWTAPERTVPTTGVLPGGRRVLQPLVHASVLALERGDVGGRHDEPSVDATMKANRSKDGSSAISSSANRCATSRIARASPGALRACAVSCA